MTTVHDMYVDLNVGYLLRQKEKKRYGCENAMDAMQQKRNEIKRNKKNEKIGSRNTLGSSCQVTNNIHKGKSEVHNSYSF
jgi:hypothetical protein